jgi:hypothetical protein
MRGRAGSGARLESTPCGLGRAPLDFAIAEADVIVTATGARNVVNASIGDIASAGEKQPPGVHILLRAVWQPYVGFADCNM